MWSDVWSAAITIVIAAFIRYTYLKWFVDIRNVMLLYVELLIQEYDKN